MPGKGAEAAIRAGDHTVHSDNVDAFLATTILSAGGSLAQAEVKVVTSIKPIRSLVSAVMVRVGEPSLMVKGAGSPHTYSLKPSQAK